MCVQSAQYIGNCSDRQALELIHQVYMIATSSIRILPVSSVVSDMFSLHLTIWLGVHRFQLCGNRGGIRGHYANQHPL
jgi:hypothetical protein